MLKSLVFHCTWADWNKTSERRVIGPTVTTRWCSGCTTSLVLTYYILNFDVGQTYDIVCHAIRCRMLSGLSLACILLVVWPGGNRDRDPGQMSHSTGISKSPLARMYWLGGCINIQYMPIHAGCIGIFRKISRMYWDHPSVSPAAGGRESKDVLDVIMFIQLIHRPIHRMYWKMARCLQVYWRMYWMYCFQWVFKSSGILTTWHKHVQTCLNHVCTVYVQC